MKDPQHEDAFEWWLLLPIRIITTRVWIITALTLGALSIGLHFFAETGGLHQVAAYLAEILRTHYGTRGQVARVHAGLTKLLGLSAVGGLFLGVASLLLVRIVRGRRFLEARGHFGPLQRLTWWDLGLSAGLTLAAGASRIGGLDQSLWQDELGQWIVFIQPGWTANLFPKVALGPQPLLQLLGLISAHVIGDTEVGLRLPVFLASAATPPLIYLIVRRTTNSYLAAIAGAVLLVAHSYHAHYSYQFRAYGIVGLLAVLSTFFWLASLAQPSRRHLVCYVAATTALLYTHLYTVTIVIAQAATTVLAGVWPRVVGAPSRGERVPLLPALAVFTWVLLLAALLYVPYIPPLAMHHLGHSSGPRIAEHLSRVASSLPLLVSADTPALVGDSLVALAVLLTFGAARNAKLLGLQLVLFLVVVAGIPPGGTGFQGRYLFPAVPLLCWLVGSQLSAEGPRVWLAGSISLAILVVSLNGWPRAFVRLHPLKEAAQMVRARSCPTAAIAANSLSKGVLVYYEPRIIQLKGPEHLERLLKEKPEVWVITSFEGFENEFLTEDLKTQDLITRRLILEARLAGRTPVSVWRTPWRDPLCSGSSTR